MIETPPPVPTKSNILLPALVVLLIGVLSIAGYIAWTILYPPSTAVTLRKSQTIQPTATTVDNAPDVDAPTPTPNKGPGNYVCDILGVCNIADEKGKVGCPVTFADPNCLNACEDTAKRCP